jgi:hypothetical protein
LFFSPKYSVALKRFEIMLKKNLSVYLLIILLGGFFWSRAILSITVAVWAVISFYQIIKENKSVLKSSIFIWSLIPLCLWLLGAWQEPMGKLNFDYFLTLTGYPAIVLIVFATPKEIIENKWIKIWLWATALAVTYPLFWYLKDFTAAHKAYGTGQSLPTFMDTDHVRFSIFLCSSFLFILCSNIIQKKFKIIFATVLFIFILFFSVRTGWVLLLSIIFLYVLLNFIKSKQINILQLLKGSILLIASITIFYFAFPNMQQKIAYSIWEYQQYQPGKYNPNFSDGTRRSINDAAWQWLQTNTSANTGWQSVPATLQSAFSKYFMHQTTEFGWPFNQWLYWWLGSGWWGMLLFSIWLFYPLVKALQQNNFGIICWTLAIALSCIVETTLNYQYGVLLHILPLAILWKTSPTSGSDNS